MPAGLADGPVTAIVMHDLPIRHSQRGKLAMRLFVARITLLRAAPYTEVDAIDIAAFTHPVVGLDVFE